MLTTEERQKLVELALKMSKDELKSFICSIEKSSPYLNIKKGDFITFGSYVQGIKPDVSSSITWKVVETFQDKALLISKYALDVVPYDSSIRKTQWTKSGLYSWLNEIFFNIAFTDEEQSMIIAKPDSEQSRYKNIFVKPPAPEKIFVLTKEEIAKYFSEDVNSIACYGTQACLKRAEHFIDSTKVFYWTCGSNNDNNQIISVTPFGDTCYKSQNENTVAVRPALFIRCNTF